eukprot:758646-Hanusia_phi.AAC.2
MTACEYANLLRMVAEEEEEKEKKKEKEKEKDGGFERKCLPISTRITDNFNNFNSCPIALFSDMPMRSQYGTFFGTTPEVTATKSQKKTVLLALGAALLVVGVVVVASSRRVALSQIDRDDGTDALINAVLVARGDSLPTKFVASRLDINPKLPFLGSSAYKGKHIKAAPRRRPALKQARLQSLALDPASQFCADPADCARDLDYFKAVSELRLHACDATWAL